MFLVANIGFFLIMQKCWVASLADADWANVLKLS